MPPGAEGDGPAVGALDINRCGKPKNQQLPLGDDSYQPVIVKFVGIIATRMSLVVGLKKTV